MKIDYSILHLFFLCFLITASCQSKNNNPSTEKISQLSLKKGALISCGPPGTEYGSLSFQVPCSEKVREEFNLGVKLLHSFEYDEAEKAFAAVIDKDPGCAMAYWGVAMSNFHPLWTAPAEPELKKGAAALLLAKGLEKTKREAAYIDAITAFYNDWQATDHRTRTLNFEKGMETVYRDYPDDKEAAVFYALSLMAAADPNDKSFAKQKKAGDILQSLYPGQPGHPGIAHYLIHTYDYPELAKQGLPAARKYASIAPSSAHALHMPSHIFTRTGLWDECIQSNQASVASAKCYAEEAGIKGHWDEELHGLDYLVYAYLQKGEKDPAKQLIDYLKTIREIHPANFKVAYAFAAIPSRYLLENRMWREAATLELTSANFDWNDFPWQKAIHHFTRLMGSIHTNNLDAAKKELKQLATIHNTLVSQKDNYKANQVAIQMKTGEAWILMKKGKNEAALALMQLAADMEDKTEKHPVTPCEVIPAKELLGDMRLALNEPVKALEAYEADLLTHPNRLNGLKGAALAAQRAGLEKKAKLFLQQVSQVTGSHNEKELP